MAQNVFSVYQINTYIQNLMDKDALLSGIAVRGEISNYKKYPSGHHYFSLKDENASLRCVMFRGNAASLRFIPENGMKIIAFGKISAYPRDGVYQLYCSAMKVDGTGDLYAAFEQLKKKLSAKGLFDESHKQKLPLFPKTIGIVTSSAGAAVHDMLKILRRKFPIAKVRLFPVRVQGPEAPGEIAGAIAFANRNNMCDVLIVGRGGGSIEDLWAFNDERVAQAIYDSQIPIISAVGHEPDVTIADYVADVRAATPTHGAEIAVPDRFALEQQLDSTVSVMSASLLKRIQREQDRLHRITSSPVMQAPTGYLSLKESELSGLNSRLKNASDRSLQSHKHCLAAVSGKLDAMSPLKVLARGYGMVQTNEGELLSSIDQTDPGDLITVKLYDGSIQAEVRKKEYTNGKESVI